MRTLLKEKHIAFNELHNEVFEIYPKDQIIHSIARVLIDVKGLGSVDLLHIEEALFSVLNKTETYNVLLTMLELDKMLPNDKELIETMKDDSYNQHRTIALNICDMYGYGATSFFGYVDCMFRSFFPLSPTKSFLSKGIAAVVASTSTVVIGDHIKEDYTQKNIELLKLRGVSINDISEIVLDVQKPYNPNLTLEQCEEHVLSVLRKQQVYHTIQLSVKIDKGVEQGLFGEQFTNIVGKDEGLYGIDEKLNTAIAVIYGMIAWTNFGYLDKVKPGIIALLDSKTEGVCNTFIDDSICAIAAAACGRLAHNVIPDKLYFK